MTQISQGADAVPDEKKNPLTRYEGQQADVYRDERLCIHRGECSRAKGDLFVGGRQPWCQPDLSPMEEITDVVARCPSGAITYARKDGGQAERAVPRNTVAVSTNGPLYVRGQLEIAGAPADMAGVRFRAALCRCGQSQHKPFCDNSHAATGFKDSGAVGDPGQPLASERGPLQITPAPNGPLRVTGNFTLITSSGRSAWQGTKTNLCRCGQFSTKPFCDGTHRKVGFTTE